MKSNTFITAFLAMAVLTGCVVGPDYIKPGAPEDMAFSGIAKNDDLLQVGDQLIRKGWWHSFNDPLLMRLVDQALQHNADLEIATAQLKEARALRRVALAVTKPSANLESGASRTQQSELVNAPPKVANPQSLFEMGLTASWEMDFFGRLERGVEAADASLQSSVEDRRNVMVLVISEVALNYTDLVSAQRQYQVALDNIEIAKETLRMTRLLRQQDLTDDLEVTTAHAQFLQRRSAVNEFESARRNAASRLSVLTGTTPDQQLAELLAKASSKLDVPTIPVGLASELLERRPDIRAAERRLAVGSAEIGVEMANRFPQFRLTGGLGTNAVELSDLFSSASEAWNIASILDWPLFDGGRRKASVDAAKARYDAALATYNGTVLEALSDAETAFSSYVFANKEQEDLQQVRASRQKALELSRLRFDAQLIDVFPVLEAQRELLSIESQVASIERAELVAAVNVYRALGGGWQVAEQQLLSTSPDASTRP